MLPLSLSLSIRRSLISLSHSHTRSNVYTLSRILTLILVPSSLLLALTANVELTIDVPSAIRIRGSRFKSSGSTKKLSFVETVAPCPSRETSKLVALLLKHATPDGAQKPKAEDSVSDLLASSESSVPRSSIVA